MGEVVLDDSCGNEVIEIQKPKNKTQNNRQKEEIKQEEQPIVNCLRNERIVVRYIPKTKGMVKDPRHILYGGMAENAVRYFTVPVSNATRTYVKVLTIEEEKYFEEIMGLEYNSLSIHKRVNNYWDNYMVRLTKQDTFLDLSNPDDYIKYKVLLANKDFIAPSLQEKEDRPKETYQFVLFSESENAKRSKLQMSSTMESYMEYGKIEDDSDILRFIIKTIENKPYAVNSKLDFLQNKINAIIQSNSKMFLQVVKDPLLKTKVLIEKSIEHGNIANRGSFLYLKSENLPLCQNGEDPTLNNAAKFLNLPKNQEIKFKLEALLK